MQGDRYHDDEGDESHDSPPDMSSWRDIGAHDLLQGDDSKISEIFLVDDLIPTGTVTQLSGDGGVGKSTLAVALCVSAITGAPWCGVPMNQCYTPRPILYVTGEESAENIRHKLSTLLFNPASPYAFEGLTAHDLRYFRILDLTESPMGTHLIDSDLKPTFNWKVLKSRVKKYKPRLLILDSQVDMFGANENDRRDVRAFVSMLRGLEYITVVVLAHPSVRGLQGGGESGSTAWRNAYRSNLYAFRRGGIVRVQSKKTNYAQPGRAFDVVWSGGVFVPYAAPVKLPNTFEAATGTDATAEFLDRLKAFKPPLTDKPRAPNYAPRVFAKESDRFNVADFARAMVNLLKAGTIGSREYQDAHRNKRKRLVVV